MNTPTLDRRFARPGARETVQQNETFIRQGEWLFVPVPGLIVDAKRVRRDAPVSRRDNDNLVIEELFRTGGEAVYYSATKCRVLTVPQFRKLLRQHPQAVREDWRIRQREAAAYGRGTVRHPGHRTVALREWHRILTNTDPLARNLARPPSLEDTTMI